MSVTTKQPRINFASVKNPLPFPDFLDVQLKSFSLRKWHVFLYKQKMYYYNIVANAIIRNGDKKPWL